MVRRRQSVSHDLHLRGSALHPANEEGRYAKVSLRKIKRPKLSLLCVNSTARYARWDLSQKWEQSHAKNVLICMRFYQLCFRWWQIWNRRNKRLVRLQQQDAQWSWAGKIIYELCLHLLFVGCSAPSDILWNFHDLELVPRTIRNQSRRYKEVSIQSPNVHYSFHLRNHFAPTARAWHLPVDFLDALLPLSFGQI